MFTDLSIWTMIHGIVLGGAALLSLGAALFGMASARPAEQSESALSAQSRSLTRLCVFSAVVLWLLVFVGTYVIFPAYRAAPPEGVTDLSRHPRSFLLANPQTAWLHLFAMELKEHVPWIASMLATAVAFAGVRYGSALLRDSRLRGMAVTLLAVCFMLTAFVGLMGVLVNKAAPLQ